MSSGSPRQGSGQIAEESSALNTTNQHNNASNQGMLSKSDSQKALAELRSDPTVSTNTQTSEPISAPPLKPENSNGDIGRKLDPQSNLTTPDKPAKKRSLLTVPSRSSSKTKRDQSSTSTTLAGANAPEDAQNTERGSIRRGIIGRRREGSRTSSRHSRAAQKEVKQGQTIDTTSTAPAGNPKPEKKGSKGLLAFLNCCGGPDGSESVDAPTKKDIALPSTPKKEKAEGAGTNTAASPGQESPEKVRHGEHSEDTRNEEKQPSKSAADTGPATETEHANQSSAIPVPPNLTTEKQSQQLPPLPSASPNGSEKSPSSRDRTEHDPTGPERESAEKDTSTPFRAKGDGDDVEMPDAPATDVTRETELSSVPSQPDASMPKTNLPPPPPPASKESTAASQVAPNLPATSQENQQWLLPPVRAPLKGRKCLILDLDETLVHSSFKILNQADFTIPVEIEGQYHNVYVIKRPGVDQFMKRVGELYEIVVFTASVSKYGDPLLDQLDIHHVVHHRLFRESCYNHQGNYVKDLSQVGRDLRETIIIDNSPTSYIFHPQHAVPISSWFSDAHDNELLDLIPVLEDLAGSQVRDVSLVLDVAL
ncbi:MAG: hypothetical protein Q9227_000518 [Pyrenula ochraceoflavens]